MTEMRGMRESGSERSGRMFIGMQCTPGAALGPAGLAAVRGIT